MSLYDEALAFAAGAHAAMGQRRRYTGEPYIEHCKEVVDVLKKIAGIYKSEVLAAAVLHDVLEDTGVTEDDLSRYFGDYVTGLVQEVTAPSKPKDGNRAQRKLMDQTHYGKASPEGQSIKLADLISNASSIAEHDPAFAKVYMKEKRDLLKVLTEGNASLREQAQKIVDDYFANEQACATEGPQGGANEPAIQ